MKPFEGLALPGTEIIHITALHCTVLDCDGAKVDGCTVVRLKRLRSSILLTSPISLRPSIFDLTPVTDLGDPISDLRYSEGPAL